jgi:hypothetical protein
MEKVCIRRKKKGPYEKIEKPLIALPAKFFILVDFL